MTDETTESTDAPKAPAKKAAKKAAKKVAKKQSKKPLRAESRPQQKRIATQADAKPEAVELKFADAAEPAPAPPASAPVEPATAPAPPPAPPAAPTLTPMQQQTAELKLRNLRSMLKELWPEESARIDQAAPQDVILISTYCAKAHERALETLYALNPGLREQLNQP